MILTFYTTADAPNKIDKSVTQIKTITGAICKENCSVLTPVFIVAYDALLLNCNYAYCADFGRYYYITNITVVTGGRLQINCKVDVLTTYAQYIKNVPAVLVRSEQSGYTQITDNKLPIGKNKLIRIAEFEGGDFNINAATDTNYNFVLNIMGGGANNES